MITPKFEDSATDYTDRRGFFGSLHGMSRTICRTSTRGRLFPRKSVKSAARNPEEQIRDESCFLTERER